MASRCQNEGKLALRCPSTNRLWGNMQERRGFGRSQVLVSSGREIVRHVETATSEEQRRGLAAGRCEPLSIRGKTIEVDTTDFSRVDYPQILARISAATGKA